MIFYTIMIIVLIIKNIKNISHKSYNQYNYDLYNPKLSVPIKKDVNVHYIFWTGGYDSTFLVLYYLMYTPKDVKIQPIYLF